MTLFNNKYSLSLLILAFIACFLLLINVMPKPEFQSELVEMHIVKEVSPHARERHGPEVIAAIECINKNGTFKSFKSSKKEDDGSITPTNVWVCIDGNDWYALVTTVFEKVGKNKLARLVTAYKVNQVRNSTLYDYFNYLYKGGAVDINYIISPRDIMFESIP
jgi:hypothetical protein